MAISVRAGFAAIVLLLAPIEAAASTCYAFVKDIPGVRYADLGTLLPASYAPKTVKITFVSHSTYRIETDDGIVIATDFSGYAGRGQDGGAVIPTVVTMNNAHSTHFTDYPDPAIAHVLRGWNPNGDGPAEHRLELSDVTIRNVTTDIRGWGAPRLDGNSIFVFEVADLCIGHLGHLHHDLDDAHIARLGRLDIVMAAVDGSYTLDIPSMVGLLKRLKARIVLPMHIFGPTSLQSFLSGMSEAFLIDASRAGQTITVSLETLPSEPTVMVLPAYIPSGLD